MSTGFKPKIVDQLAQFDDISLGMAQLKLLNDQSSFIDLTPITTHFKETECRHPDKIALGDSWIGYKHPETTLEDVIYEVLRHPEDSALS